MRATSLERRFEGLDYDEGWHHNFRTLRPQPCAGCVHLAPQNAPQIASCAVFSRRLVLSLVLVKVVCRRVASSGEKRINTFTRLRSQVRVLQRPRIVVRVTGLIGFQCFRPPNEAVGGRIPPRSLQSTTGLKRSFPTYLPLASSFH